MATWADSSVEQLPFPVLCLSRDTSITVADNARRLQRCNARAFFKNGYFDDLIIFDSNGEQYRVVQAEIAPPLTGMKKWLTYAFNRRLIVRLKLQRETPASVATAKQHVLIWLKKAQNVWEETRDIGEWEQMVKDAPDMGRILELFA